MAKAPKNWKGGRALLNGPGYHSTAAIVAEVQDMSHMDGKTEEFWSHCPDAILQISDCSRSISFDLDWSTIQDRENTLRKVDTLIDTLSDFRDHLVAEQIRFAAYRERT